MNYLLDNARLPGEESLCQLSVNPGRVAILPAGSNAGEGEYWDLQGRLVLPGFADLHTHLDKTYAQVNNAAGGLLGAIEAFREYKAQRTLEDVERAATRALRKAVSEGVTCLRSHVNAASAQDVDLVRVLHEVRTRFAPMIDVQLVAMGVFGEAEESYITACVEAGADLIGGAPALQMYPHTAVSRAVAMAAELEIALDLHIDEHLEPELCTLATLCDEVRQQDFRHGVTAGHCASLAVLPEDRLVQLMGAVRDAGISVVALPVCNMVLLGGPAPPYIRGTAPVSRLMQAGVNVCLGSDNVRDPFNPFGGYGALKNLQLSNILERHNSDQAIAASLPLIADNAHRTFSGGPAPEGDLVVLDATDLLDALCDPPPCLATFKGGQRVYRRELNEVWSLQDVPA